MNKGKRLHVGGRVLLLALAVAGGAAMAGCTSAYTSGNSNPAPPDTTPPMVSITAPAQGATVMGTVSVTANASDNVGVASVQFQVDSANVGSLATTAPYSHSWNTTSVANGSHTLTAVAKDTAGNSTTSSGVIVTVSNTVNTSMGPLVQSSTNSRYFVIQGTTQAVLLSGSHTWNDFLDIGLNGSPTTFDFNGFVSFLTAHGQNATILWRKDLPVECGWINGTDIQTPWPWLRPGPGTASDGQPKWDLTQFNQAYFDRLRQRVIQLQQSGIYAIIELFDGNNVASARCGNSAPNGDGYPFTGVNNINGVDDGYTSGSTGVGSFTMTTNNAVTNAQDAFVKKTIDTLNDLPNVLWELAEEQPGNGSFFTGSSGYGGASSMQFWAPHMVGLIKAYEGGGTWEGITYPGKPFKHPVGIGSMSSQDPDDQALYSSPVDWLAPTINTNFANQFPSNVSTNNQGKVVINDSDHAFDVGSILNPDGSLDTAQTSPYLWENLTSGAAGVLFMDPYVVNLPSGSPIRNTCLAPFVNGICTGGLDSKYEPFRTELRYLPVVAAMLDLVKTTPQPNLSSTGFCLADAVASGAEYLVYAPNGGTFTVNLSATTHNLTVEWIDPTTGVPTIAGTVIGGSSSQSFTTPSGSSHDAVLYLVDVAGHN
jgi:Big-like domain-containing protein/collagenase-like protein with putative collagen-binding domain